MSVTGGGFSGCGLAVSLSALFAGVALCGGAGAQSADRDGKESGVKETTAVVERTGGESVKTNRSGVAAKDGEARERPRTEVLEMSGIKIERNPAEERLKELGVRGWPIWKKEVSKFPWTYEQKEVCFFLEGDVVVTPDGEKPVRVGKGDLVTLPRGMSCTWDIRKDVRKHYRFE